MANVTEGGGRSYNIHKDGGAIEICALEKRTKPLAWVGEEDRPLWAHNELSVMGKYVDT